MARRINERDPQSLDWIISVSKFSGSLFADLVPPAFHMPDLLHLAPGNAAQYSVSPLSIY
jgi:hypothetical protein